MTPDEIKCLQPIAAQLETLALAKQPLPLQFVAGPQDFVRHQSIAQDPASSTILGKRKLDTQQC